MKFKFGNKIKLILKSEEEIIGHFVPSNDDKFMTLKLDSGYNQNIKLSDIDSTKVLEEKKVVNKSSKEIKQDDSLPLIILLHVGGTIASKVDYATGGVSSQIEPEELLDSIPELKKIARIKTKILFNILSENIRFKHYNIIAKNILESLDEKIAGVIISHGTDTLHYTATGLSFILQNIKIPIVLVGSQRSSDRPSSDSAINLISATKFIVDQVSRKDQKTGVFVSMHGTSNDNFCSIYSGLNLKKLHSSRRDAFKQINSLPIAKVFNKKIEYSPIKNIEEISSLFEPAFFKEDMKIGIIKSHPNMFAEELNCYKNFDGIILEGTGLGHFPIENDDKQSSENKKIFSTIEEISKKVPVVITTQCINGSTNLNVYSVGRKLKKLGILEAGAMITETAFIKLCWLLSNFSKDEIKEMWNRNFVGEVISRNIYEKE